MARVTVEDCLKIVPNRFVLVLLATKRTRQLLDGSQPLVRAKNKLPIIALREIAAGKVRLRKVDSPNELNDDDTSTVL